MGTVAALKLAGRHAVLRALLLRIRARSVPIGAAFGPTLVVAPHQDDGTLGCGGLIRARVLAGEPVSVVYLTDGSASHPGHPRLLPSALAEMRLDEARLAMAVLGLKPGSIHSLGAPDGKLPSLPGGERRALVGALARLISESGARDVLVTCGADASTEHEAAYGIARDALDAAPGPRLLEYPIWSRWNPLRLRRQLADARKVHLLHLDPEALSAKLEAIRCFRSQLYPVPPWTHAVLPEGFEGLFGIPEEVFIER